MMVLLIMKRGISLVLTVLFLLIPFASAELSYYHYDLQGNVRHITDSDGEVIEKSKYLPFGERFDSDMEDPRGFTGKELDKSDNYYFNARYQSPQEGRFLTPDTVKPNLENPQSLNLYTYTLNNPIKYIDPTGNTPQFYNEKDTIEHTKANSEMLKEITVSSNSDGFLGDDITSSLYKYFLWKSTHSSKVAHYTREGSNSIVKIDRIDGPDISGNTISEKSKTIKRSPTTGIVWVREIEIVSEGYGYYRENINDWRLATSYEESLIPSYKQLLNTIDSIPQEIIDDRRTYETSGLSFWQRFIVKLGKDIKPNKNSPFTFEDRVWEEAIKMGGITVSSNRESGTIQKNKK